ncbi:WD40-repeat-containing domain protein [Mrakia frigida]|uniref:WD40-repeat-containing domain protein n=1 Tax=Mrakia frigida TaxID=29902 RepID=UPI003FCC1497
MTPRFIASAASSSSTSRPSSSSQALGRGLPSSSLTLASFPSFPRRTTSTSLQILENIPSLLSTYIPESPGSSSQQAGGGPQVSLLRGFQATVPSSEKGKERRRKVRGGVATKELELGSSGKALGLKKLGMESRGLLGETEQEQETEGEGMAMTGKERRRRKRDKAAGAGGKKGEGQGKGMGGLGREELLKMEEEIGWDRENVVVRKSLLKSEIDEVQAKIAALEAIRSELEDGILKLREQDLELEDELEGIRDRLFTMTPETVKGLSSTGSGALGSGGSIPSRRRKGPAFLPSEHDDLPSGMAFMTLSNHTGSITALDFSEPYGTLVTAATDDTVRVWDLCSGEETGRLRGHTGTVKAIQADDQLCLTGGADGNIRLWDLRLVEDYEDSLVDVAQSSRIGGGSGGVLESSSAARAAAANGMMMSEEGGGGENEEGGGGEVENGGSAGPPNPCVRTLEGHSKSVTSLYYEDGCLVTGSSDKTIRQWDVNTGQCVLTMDILWAISNPPALPSSSSSSSRPSSENRRRTSSFADTPGSLLSGASLLSVTSGTFAVPTPPFADGSWEMYQDFVGGVQFWGYALASGSGDGGVRMWDMRTGQAHRTLIGHTGPVTSIQFDEMHVISGSLDKTIRIWDLRTGTVSDVLKYEFPVTSLQFDTRKILACTGENGIENYNRTSRQHSTLRTNGHILPAERLRYQDRFMVSGGKDSLVKIWSL